MYDTLYIRDDEGKLKRDCINR